MELLKNYGMKVVKWEEKLMKNKLVSLREKELLWRMNRNGYERVK